MLKGKKSEYHSNNTTVNEIVEEFVVQSEGSSPIRPVMAEIEEPLQVNKAGKKRIADSDYDPAEFSHEMQKMLDGFGADISKTLVQKKKRMEQLTQASLKNANKKVEEIWKNQQIARARLQEEFSKQVLLVYQQWESDIEKFKEQEEKLNARKRGKAAPPVFSVHLPVYLLVHTVYLINFPPVSWLMPVLYVGVLSHYLKAKT
ncbi:Synaptonemal complex protein 3 [Bulinus truncatus]|nr:Synaptonemal complex protein 3 [Bulinus truncatus]